MHACPPSEQRGPTPTHVDPRRPPTAPATTPGDKRKTTRCTGGERPKYQKCKRQGLQRSRAAQPALVTLRCSTNDDRSAAPGGIWPNPVEFGAIPDQMWPLRGQVWPKLGHACRFQTKFGRIRASVIGINLSLPGELWSNLVETGPKLAASVYTSSNSASMLRSGLNLAEFGRWPNYGQS